MAVSQFVRIDDHLLVGVCFDQPGMEGWQLGPATLSYDSGSLSSFMGTVTVDKKGSTDNRVGSQCNKLEFSDLPKGADLGTFTLSVESVLLAAPDEGKECEVYNARLSRSLVLKERGITADCTLGEGYSLFSITSKPTDMPEADAQLLVSQQAAGFVIGPWTFTGTPITVTK